MFHTLLHRCRSWFDPGRGPRRPARRARLARPAAEPLEGRAVPAALTQFVFNLPPSVESRGVELAIFGQRNLPAGSPAQFLYLSGTTSNPASFAYKEVPNVSGQLPEDGMIPLTDGSIVPIPTDVLVGGEAVLFVGPDSGIATTAQSNSPTGSVAVPTVGTNPNDIFSLFELTNLSTPSGTLQLDLDISDIDQVGFPYTVTSSAPAGSATPSISASPYPLGVVGQTVDRPTLLASFQAAFPGDSPFQESWRLGIDATGTFQRLVSPQDVLSVYQADGPRMVPVAQGQPQYPGATYKVTAISSTGETRADTGLAALLADGGGLVRWQPYTGIQAGAGTEFVRGGTPTTGYKIYKSTNGTDYGLIGQVGATATSFPDPALAPDLSQSPPSNSYGFDPLSTYFTEAIQDFFSYYASPREFVYDQAPQVSGSAARTTWRGSTVANYQPAGEAHEYTALVLTGHGGDFDGQQVAILSPLFSSNTNLPGLPPMSNYLVNGGTASYASPSQMVFACNGVFADNAINPSAAGNVNLQTALGNIQNVIVSALNRGLTSYNDPAAAPADPDLPPDQWVNPLLFSADPVASPGGPTPASSLAGRYYYVVTTVLPGGETVPTREVVATLQAGDNRVSLSWLPINGNPDPSLNPVGYRVYRSTSPGAEVLIAELGPDQTTGWTDEFTSSSPLGGPPPSQFYAAGNVSNLYSAFLHRNSTTDPAAGISVNGLAYGYPFDDQGSFSTNIQYAAGQAPATVTFDLKPWTNSSAAPTTTTLAYTPGSPVEGQPVTLVATVVPSTGGTPGGAVVFVVDGVAQAPVPLAVSGGQAVATLVLNGLAAGDHTVVAIYSGDETDAPSESPTLPLVVASPVPGSRVASTTQLAISPDPASPGQPFTLTSTVARTVGGGTPGGTVTFIINGVAQSPVPLAVVGGRSVASLFVPGLPAGNYAVAAAYSGDPSALPSTSAPATLAVVNAADGPSVVRVDRFGYHAAPTTLAIRFLGTLDATRASDVASYRLVGPGGGRIRVRSASYDAATSTVTLSPTRRLSLHHSYRLTVVGTPPAGITNSAGVYLNGSGSPGTNYTTRLTGANLVTDGPIPSGPPRLARWARVGGR